MLDVSLAAVEEQLAIAQSQAGRPAEQAALARAQIIATLLTADTNLIRIAENGTWSQRVAAAAELIGYTPDMLEAAIGYFDTNPVNQDDVGVVELDLEDTLPPLLPDTDADDVDDFFAEVRKERDR